MKEVRTFLRLTSYYKHFVVPYYSEVAAPLRELTRKKAPNKVIWEERHQKGFETLRHLLSCEPILKSSNLQEHFLLRTDTLCKSITTVLMQRNDGVFHPVTYASRKLQEGEARYSTVEREGLALI